MRVAVKALPGLLERILQGLTLRVLYLGAECPSPKKA